VSIHRIGIGTRWSDMVVHNGTIYLVEVPTSDADDITAQAHDVLASLDASLGEAGSSKSHLLMVTIYLADIADIEGFNAVWDAWLPPGGAPVRACVQARLANPRYRVEVQVVAATM
jgi:enamine deaminase RidA (YjgF/YER057c/UK114 family)